MIARGATDGDSNRARKAYRRRLEVYEVRMKMHRGPIINFEREGLTGVATPHIDSLVIQATIVNYVVARVFVDIGRSVNIIFEEAFDQM